MAARLAFLNDEQCREMLRLGAARARGEAIDPYPMIKLYTPDADTCWVLVSIDADEDRAYGLIDSGTGFPALGEVSLSMLASIVGPRGMPVAIESGFRPRKRLSAYLSDAQRDGMVTD